MELTYHGVANLAVLALAGLGVFVSLIHNIERRKERVYFAVAFLILAGVAWWADQKSYRRDNLILEEIREGTTGGDNFGYFLAELPEKHVPGDEASMILQSTGKLFDLKVKVTPWWAQGDSKLKAYRDGPYWIFPPTIDRGRNKIGVSLPPGDYRIEITPKNFTVLERLRIIEVNGRLEQAVEVWKIDDQSKSLFQYRSDGFTE